MTTEPTSAPRVSVLGKRSSTLIFGRSSDRHIIFLPGFLNSPDAYRLLLEPLGDDLWTVEIPRLYRPGPRVLLGRFTVKDEATAAVALVRQRQQGQARVWLAGHSRGGQAAWLAATRLQQLGAPVAGLILVDPVDGRGPRSEEPFATSTTQAFTHAPLIVGAGISGRCAPEAVNHERFAAAAEARVHLVVAEMGHADVLCGWQRSLGRRLCGGGTDPSRARECVTQLMRQYVFSELGPDSLDQLPPGVART